MGSLESQFDMQFAYSYTDFKQIFVQPGEYKGNTRESFLFKLLEPYEIIFKRSGKRKFLLRLHDNRKQGFEDWDMYLEGSIYDRENRSPLSQVAVYIENSGIGTLSDDRGNFQLRIPRKYQDATLNFRLFAYKQLKIKVGSASLQSVFQLKAEPLNVDPIKIQANNADHPDLNALAGLPPDFERIAQASNLAGPDVVRTLQLLPGVNAFDDLNSELKIRGSGGDETLIVLDGIPIYRSDHYFGIFSSISSDYLDKVELYKNILPLEYGGKTGGMILMEAPDKLDEFSAKIDLNLLSSSANLRIPLGKGSSLILNGRTTLGNAADTDFFESVGRKLDLNELLDIDFTRLNVVVTDPDFRFYDTNAKLNLALGKSSGLRLNFFRSHDKLVNTYQLNFKSRNNDFAVQNQETFTDTQNWSSTGTSLQFYSLLSPNLRLEANLFSSDYQENTSIKTTLVRMNRFNTRQFERINERNNSISDFGGGVNLKRYFDQDILELGVNSVQHSTEVDFEQSATSVLAGDAESSEINLYANYRINRGPWLLDLGHRVNYYGLNGEFYFSPRLQASYKPSEEFKLKAAWGISNQFVREVQHENQWGRVVNYFIAADEVNYPVGRSENYMLGFTYAKGPWTLDVEGFYRNLDGVVEHALVSPGLDSLNTTLVSKDYRLYVGEGVSKGIDFFLGYDSKRYSSWISYTLSKTTHQFDDVFRGQPFASQDDRRHQVKWVNSLNIGRFTLSANYIYSSGRAYLDISSLNRLASRNELDPSSLIKRLPFYGRIDLGLNYGFSFGKSSGSVGFSVFNLANRENVDYLQYVFAVPVSPDGNNFRSEVIGNQSGLLDRTLNLNLRLDLK
ncbi:MAG: carboxypeptidase-like regulatory domain-containing protein [Bacteroidota bacterium]